MLRQPPSFHIPFPKAAPLLLRRLPGASRLPVRIGHRNVGGGLSGLLRLGNQHRSVGWYFYGRLRRGEASGNLIVCAHSCITPLKSASVYKSNPPGRKNGNPDRTRSLPGCPIASPERSRRVPPLRPEIAEIPAKMLERNGTPRVLFTEGPQHRSTRPAPFPDRQLREATNENGM